jgi:copper(I)-binding protein
LAAAALWLGAAHAADTVTVADAWVRATPPGATTAAAYLTLTNRGAPNSLARVTSPSAARVEVHATTEHNGMMHMSPVDAIPLPTGAAVELAPGGLHVMLIDIRAPLKAGDRVPLTLELGDGATIEIEAPVRDARAVGSP